MPVILSFWLLAMVIAMLWAVRADQRDRKNRKDDFERFSRELDRWEKAREEMERRGREQ